MLGKPREPDRAHDHVEVILRTVGLLAQSLQRVADLNQGRCVGLNIRGGGEGADGRTVACIADVKAGLGV